MQEFARRVRELYPQCPRDREVAIAEHACLKYSGRVGGSGLAKSYDEQAIRLAVVAHVRHTATRYDDRIRGEQFRHSFSCGNRSSMARNIASDRYTRLRA